MNLASRCREAISHVAMLKKELAMQQKTTAQALASQRQQTQRMADSLTSSFISNSSSPDTDCSSSSSKLRNKSHRVSDENDDGDDDNVLRLVSNTPSPDRTSLRVRENIDVDESHSSKFVTTTTANTTAAAAAAAMSTRASSPTEEFRDSPATSTTASPKAELNLFSNLDEDETVVDTISPLKNESNSAEELIDVETNEKKQQTPVLYSIPKRSERSSSSKFHVESDRDYDEEVDEVEVEAGTGMGLFPFSASPKTFTKSHSNRGNKSYDEEFPSDVIDQPENNGSTVGSHGKDSRHNRKMNLMNSIDAFEKSFSTDFPDSFTPKEGTNKNNTSGEGSEQRKIYNPFFATPEKQPKDNHHSNLPDVNDDGSPEGRLKTGGDSYVYNTPTEEKKENEPFDIEYDTPPKINIENKPPSGITNKNNNNNDNKEEPGRPEKIIPTTARARYERALGPRESIVNSTTQNEIEPSQKSSQSRDMITGPESNSPSALFRRMQQKRRMSSNKQNSVEETASGSSSEMTELPPAESPSSKQRSITSIVDAFEQNDTNMNADFMNGGVGDDSMEKQQNSKSSSSRFHPIKSMRRRSVKTPISYAEPALNTKLRRGDTYFPKANDQPPQVVSP
jgi:hypothetical protein